MKKPTRMPARLEPGARRANLSHRRALVHGIQHALAAALRADPRLAAARVAQRLGHPFADQVGASLYGEGNRAARRACGGREIENPVDPEAENVVGKPDVLGIEAALEMRHFDRNVVRAALQVMVPPGGLGAPRATKGAAARAGHVQTEIAVRLQPHRAVSVHVHEIPRREPIVMRNGQNPGAVDRDYFRLAERGDAVSPSISSSLRHRGRESSRGSSSNSADSPSPMRATSAPALR